MQPATPFLRSDDQFFHQQMTRTALLALATGEKLTIYCGAGVTIDRTGLGWGQLIASIFTPDGASHPSHPTKEEIDIMRRSEDPMRLASILTQYGLDQAKTPSKLKSHLTPLLQNRLYKVTGWQAGLLVNNVCSVATTAAANGVEVDVITTNYDTHLEDGFARILTRFRDRLEDRGETDQLKRVPKIVVRVRDEDCADERDLLTIGSPTAEAALNLHYVHGRIDQENSSAGHLVMSELDYALARPHTLETLRRLFDGNRHTIILGASLTDPPLVDALALTKPEKKRHEFNRYVVMPRSSLHYDDQDAKTSNRIVSHLGRRAELLGIQLLVPDFRIQVAQFLEELHLCMRDDASPLEFLSDERGERYGCRLLTWWTSWQEREIARTAEHAYQEVSKHFQDIKQLIAAASAVTYGESQRQERFRLELWVREDPARFRALTKWASSSGPVLDPDVRRTAELELDSGNASVRTFMEGRPQHLAASDLREMGFQSRWLSYLCVPIWVRVSSGQVPVGVLTLASNRDTSASALPLPKMDFMEQLRNMMIAAGKAMLNPSDAPEVIGDPDFPVQPPDPAS